MPTDIEGEVCCHQSGTNYDGLGNGRCRTSSLLQSRSLEHWCDSGHLSFICESNLCLLVASVYTELNAVTKGVSLGIYSKDKDKGREATKDGSQPYVDLMGRRV